ALRWARFRSRGRGIGLGQLIRFGLFAGFLLLGGAVRFAAPAMRRRLIGLLLGYIAFVHFAVMLAEREAWPFASYQVLHGEAGIDTRIWRLDFFGVDTSGQALVPDPYSFEPLYAQPLQAWVRGFLPLMPKPDKQIASAFLLARAESARQRLASGKFIGYERYLGPLGAPYWFLLLRSEKASQLPYRELRVDIV